MRFCARLLPSALTLVGCISILSAPVLADNTGLGEALHSLSKERGRTCFTDHTHTGSGDTRRDKNSAMASAVDAWRGFTAAEYGSDWAHFNLAVDKKFSCSQASGGVQCQVEARPCRH